MLVFWFISKTKKCSAQSVNVKLVFSCKTGFFSNLQKDIGFLAFFWGGGAVIVVDRFRSENFLNPGLPQCAKSIHLSLNLNSLLVKCQIDNPSPGAVTGGNQSLALTREVNFNRYTII